MCVCERVYLRVCVCVCVAVCLPIGFDILLGFLSRYCRSTDCLATLSYFSPQASLSLQSACPTQTSQALVVVVIDVLLPGQSLW